MKIWDVRERKDGGCVLEVGMTEYEKQILIEKGFAVLLEEFLDKHEKQFVDEGETG